MLKCMLCTPNNPLLLSRKTFSEILAIMESSEESSPVSESPSVGFKPYKRRWYILSLFAILALHQCLVWNTFGPIDKAVKYAYKWVVAYLIISIVVRLDKRALNTLGFIHKFQMGRFDSGDDGQLGHHTLRRWSCSTFVASGSQRPPKNSSPNLILNRSGYNTQVRYPIRLNCILQQLNEACIKLIRTNGRKG